MVREGVPVDREMTDIPSHGSGLGGHTLHQATVSEEAVDLVVNELVSVLVVGSGHVLLSHGETDSVGESLTKRSGSDLDSATRDQIVSIPSLRRSKGPTHSVTPRSG